MSTTGIYGLSGSGIDVDSMVKVGMLSKQNEYDRLYKKEVKNEWIKEAYANLYSDLATFNNSTMSSYKMSSATNPHSATSTNTGAVTATANADAAEMSHTVNVSAMASNAYMLSTEKISRANPDAASSIYLKDILFTEGEADALQQKISSGEINPTDTILKFSVADGAGSNHTTETISFSYEDILSNNETIYDLVSKFNNSGVNVKASYDATNEAFALYQKDGGKENQIVLDTAGDTDNGYGKALLQKLKLGEVKSGATGSSSLTPLDFGTGTSISTQGSDAEVTIDGKKYTASSNKISVANVTYTISSTGDSTVSVSQDTDKIIENVKKFVEDYNKMLDSLNAKYSETKYTDYGVLTKSQENGMSKEQIDKWNEKAKSGLLQHDSNIGKLRTALREAIYTPVASVDSSYNSMMAIGIESSTDQGHLRLDEEKLKKALAADPDCVYQLFSSSGDVTTTKNGVTKTTTDYNKEGVINRIYDKVNATMKDMKAYAGTSTQASDGSTLGTLITDLQTKMSNFKTMMDAFESALYKKYDAMESAIAKLSAQFNFVSGS